ncbi:MAG TPA: methyltransferase, partial [Rhodocyclaceae bacterium]|nr:methyltransferase [Rhodocyclaceae bacterium]
MAQAAPALDTLLLPFELGDLTWPEGPVLFLRARAGAALHGAPKDRLLCEQSFKPHADALEAAGFTVTGEESEGAFSLVLVLTPRQREESKALLARALQRATPGGIVIAAAANTEGARSAESDLEQLAGSVRSESKNKCRVFWAVAGGDNNESLIAEWAALDAPRPIAEGRFWSRPGLFAWDRIDSASALLAQHLPKDLKGRGADLGAGYGYLSAEVLARCS